MTLDEALREAHALINDVWTRISTARNGESRHNAQVQLKRLGAAIDRLAKIAALEQAEKMVKMDYYQAHLERDRLRREEREACADLAAFRAPDRPFLSAAIRARKP